MEFIIYNLKVAICLIAFYLIYKLFLSRETFLRTNRATLLAMTAVAFSLPFCGLTLHQGETPIESMVLNITLSEVVVRPEQPTLMSYLTLNNFAIAVYVLGAAFFLTRIVTSVIRLWRMTRQGERHTLDDNSVLILNDTNMSPFSWVKYIIMSRKDFDENGEQILTHELAHIHFHHSIDLMVCDLICCLQWFNPAMWLIRRELCAVHEYEADKAVLDSGINAKQYQLLLIKKDAGAKWSSIANSFNHSKLKYRITMMLRKKSSRWAKAKVLLVLPVVALATVVFANVVYSQDKLSENIIRRDAFKSYTVAPINKNKLQFTEFEQNGEKMVKIEAVNADGTLRAAKRDVDYKLYENKEPLYSYTNSNLVIDQTYDEKTGDYSEPEIFVMEEDGTKRVAKKGVDYFEEKITAMAGIRKAEDQVVVKEKFEDADTDEIFMIVEEMPEFPGGNDLLSDYLEKNLKYPQEALKDKKQGRVFVSFVVEKDGSITGAKLMKNVNKYLDEEAIRVISSMPKWKPGRQRGMNVRTTFVIPVVFKLPE